LSHFAFQHYFFIMCIVISHHHSAVVVVDVVVILVTSSLAPAASVFFSDALLPPLLASFISTSSFAPSFPSFDSFECLPFERDRLRLRLWCERLLERDLFVSFARPSLLSLPLSSLVSFAASSLSLPSFLSSSCFLSLSAFEREFERDRLRLWCDRERERLRDDLRCFDDLRSLRRGERERLRDGERE